MQENGRGERIRTSGPCLPKTVLYQAELLPDRAYRTNGPAQGPRSLAGESELRKRRICGLRRRRLGKAHDRAI